MWLLIHIGISWSILVKGHPVAVKSSAFTVPSFYWLYSYKTFGLNKMAAILHMHLIFWNEHLQIWLKSAMKQMSFSHDGLAYCVPVEKESRKFWLLFVISGFVLVYSISAVGMCDIIWRLTNAKLPVNWMSVSVTLKLNNGVHYISVHIIIIDINNSNINDDDNNNVNNRMVYFSRPCSPYEDVVSYQNNRVPV